MIKLTEYSMEKLNKWDFILDEYVVIEDLFSFIIALTYTWIILIPNLIITCFILNKYSKQFYLLWIENNSFTKYFKLIWLGLFSPIGLWISFENAIEEDKYNYWLKEFKKEMDFL